MKFHTLRREQWIPRPLAEVFAFFCDAANLGVITPPWLGFRILEPRPARMETGAIIRYRISLRGLPLTWTTEIRKWEPPYRFVDVQLRGPYRLWHHTHRFEEADGGTRICDIVHYRLPFGWLGKLVNRLLVRRDVERIFEYRTRKIEEMFGTR